MSHGTTMPASVPPAPPSRTSTAPCTTGGRHGPRRRWVGRLTGVVLVVALAAAATACQLEPTRHASGAPSGKTPVLFIHGAPGQPANWGKAVAQFVEAGYTRGDIANFGYDFVWSARAAAEKLALEVDALLTYTGKAKIDIVSFSYGSMVTRYCIELGSCAGKVDHWMSLGGADHGADDGVDILANVRIGTTDACNLVPSCRDIAGRTPTIATLVANWGQITTQNVKVGVQWSPNDMTIGPGIISTLPEPAVNCQAPGALSHDDLFSDAGVIGRTIQMFATSEIGGWTDGCVVEPTPEPLPMPAA